MKQLIKKLSRVADSSTTSYVLLRSGSIVDNRKGRRRSSSPDGGASPGRRVPEGHLPVFVGEEMERFVVSAEFLNHPVFAELLSRSAQEYGYDQKGVLRIPCPAGIFRTILEILRRRDAGAGPELVELVRSTTASVVVA